MTTDRKPMSGRGRGRSSAALDKYNKDSKSKSFGRNMRTWSRTKTSHLITSWDDVHYFTVGGLSFYFLADTTGNVDSATAVSAQMEKLYNLAWETFYVNANLKDLVVNDEAAWKLYFASMMQICIDIQLQYNCRCYLPAYTESDTVPGAYADITYFNQSSFDIFCASMKNYPVPKGVYEIVDIFCTWVVKLTQEYEAFTLRIPAAIFAPFKTKYDLADLEAMRDLLRVNLGGYTTHALKFGMKSGTWRDPVKPTEKLTSDPDVIAHFNHAQFKIYDNQPVQFEVYGNGGHIGGNLTTNYTSHEYFFKDNPNESLIHLLAPWYGTYSAANNPYGGFILVEDVNAAEYYVSFAHCAQHGTAMANADMGNAVLTDMIIGLHEVAWANALATFLLKIDGTNFTAAKGMDDSWPLATVNLLFKGTNRGATETNNDLLNWIGAGLV